MTAEQGLTVLAAGAGYYKTYLSPLSLSLSLLICTEKLSQSAGKSKPTSLTLDKFQL